MIDLRGVKSYHSNEIMSRNSPVHVFHQTPDRAAAKNHERPGPATMLTFRGPKIMAATRLPYASVLTGSPYGLSQGTE